MQFAIYPFVWSFLALSLASPAEDEIKNLPGLKAKPSWRQFSGFLKASGSKKLHYWFTESANDPKTDPLVLWLNGGPGCSSLLGLLTENGPLSVQDDGMTLQYNPFSWNTVANMLYLEAPAGVGFSYSDDQNYTTDDVQTAKDNYIAIKDFFFKYPEYGGNEFFITGESYGGIYVPTLSSLVVDDTDINFKGFAVGNGLSNADLNDDSLVYFAYYHGLIGEELWAKLIEMCCSGKATNCTFSKNSEKIPACQIYLSQVYKIVYQGDLNVYNLYGRCAGSQGDGMTTRFDPVSKTLITANFGWAFSRLPQVQRERELIKKLLQAYSGNISTVPPRINASAPLKYLNTKKVREALHIPDKLPSWDVCSDVLPYTVIYRDVSAQYHKILDAGKRVLVYNGDVDMSCNFLGDEWFVDRLNRPLVKPRTEWFYIDQLKSKQVAGFVKQFERLTFVTVRGSGHMVPTDRPRPALDLFINFIRNNPF